MKYKVKQIRGYRVKFIMNRMHANHKRFNSKTPAWDYWFNMTWGY